MEGAATGPLSHEQAGALLAQSHALRDQLAALQARWQAHVEALIPAPMPAPLEDPAIAAYYPPLPKAPIRFKSVAAANAAQDKQKWQNLRHKIAAPAQHLKVDPTRKEAMSEDTTPPGPTQPALSLTQGRAPRAPEPIDPLCSAKAAAFLGEPPEDVIARYPDLAPAYQQLYDAKAFAQRNHPGHETAFIQAAIDSVASKIERGAPLTNDMFYEAKTNGDRRNAAPPKAEVLQLVRPAPPIVAPDAPPPSAPKESSMENDSAVPGSTDIPLSLVGEAAAEQADFEHAYGVSSSYAYLAEVGELLPPEEAATLAKNLIEDIRAIKGAECREDALAASHSIGIMQPLYQAEFARLAPDLVAAAQAAYNAGVGWDPLASGAPAAVPADAAPIAPEAVTPILEKAAKKSNRRNENWGLELPMPASATLTGVPVFTAISPTLEEAGALQAIVASAARMNEATNDSVPLVATKDIVAADLAQLRAISDQPTRNAALRAMHDSAIAQVQYKVALTWQADKTWREIQAAAQREQHLRDVPPFVSAAAEAVAVPPPIEVSASDPPDAKRVYDLRAEADLLLQEQKAIETIRADADLIASVALGAGYDNTTAFANAEDAEYAANALRLTAIREELAAAGEPFEAPPEVDEQTRLFRQVAGDAGYAMSGPDGGMEQREAKDMVAEHLATLARIANEHLRNLTTDAILEAAHAQQHYRAELLEQSPELHAAYLALASKSQHQGAKFHAQQARTQSLDAAALAQLEAARARDRQSVEKQLDWNTIERADSAERVPLDTPAAVPATPAASAPNVDVALTAVPPEVERAYLQVGNKFYLTSNKKHVAFEDHGATLKTALDTGKVALSMVHIAHARGWTDIKVSGTEDFRKEAWREAALRGIAVTGHTPNALDQADLARRMPAKPQNVVAPLPSAQTGIFISAEDAAILAVAKAQRAAAASPAPAAAATPPAAAKPSAGSTLIAHGPAKYKHDPTNADSYYVTLQNQACKQRTVWGIGLEEAIAKAGVKTGDQITLAKNGETAVEVEANVKNADGTAVVGTERIGATRNEWVVKAQAFANQAPEQTAVTHPELAGMLGIAMAIDKRAEADGYTPAARAIIEARVKQNLTNSIERGNIAGVKISEVLDVQPEVQQAMTQ